MIDAMNQAMYLIDAWERGAYAEEYPNEIAALRQAIEQAEKESTLQKMSDIWKEIEQVTIKQGWDVDSLLFKPEQEPVAWMFEEYGESSGGMRWFKCLGTEKPQHPESIYRNIIPLYTALPKPKNELDIAERAYFAGKQAGIAECEVVKREWVGLTDKEIVELLLVEQGNGIHAYTRAIEAKLKERNT
jgi:hypothetical protein